MASTKDIAQNQLVLARIKRRYLTSYDALLELGVSRLAARIHDLRADGHIIKAKVVEVVTRSGRVTRVKAYKLAAPELLAPHNATTVRHPTRAEVFEMVKSACRAGASNQQPGVVYR